MENLIIQWLNRIQHMLNSIIHYQNREYDLAGGKKKAKLDDKLIKFWDELAKVKGYTG